MSMPQRFKAAGFRANPAAFSLRRPAARRSPLRQALALSLSTQIHRQCSCTMGFRPMKCRSGPDICVSPLNQRTSPVAFDLKEIIAARLGENYELHHRHINRTLVAAQRVIGFDKVYARAEGAYLYDMDNNAYLDFLSGYSVFNIGRNHPVVKKAIRDVLDLDLPNMVQMDCSILSGLLAEAIVK